MKMMSAYLNESDSEDDYGVNSFVDNVIKKSSQDLAIYPYLKNSEEELISKIQHQYDKPQEGATCSKYLLPNGDSSSPYGTSAAVDPYFNIPDVHFKDVKGTNSAVGTSQKMVSTDAKRSTSASESLLYHRDHSDKLVLETLWGAKQFRSKEGELQMKEEDKENQLHSKIDFFRQHSRDDLNMIGEDEEGEIKEKVVRNGEPPGRTRTSQRKRFGFRKLFQNCCGRG